MDYDVVLFDAAKQIVRELPDDERLLVANSLAVELTGAVGENTAVLPLGTSSYLGFLDHTYYGTALTAGYVAVYRSLTAEEIAAQEAIASRSFEADVVFGVFDLVGAASRPTGFLS